MFKGLGLLFHSKKEVFEVVRSSETLLPRMVLAKENLQTRKGGIKTYSLKQKVGILDAQNSAVSPG